MLASPPPPPPTSAGKTVRFLDRSTVIPLGFVNPCNGAQTSTKDAFEAVAPRVDASPLSSRLAHSQWQWQGNKVTHAAATDAQLRKRALLCSPGLRRKRAWSFTDCPDLVQAASSSSSSSESEPGAAYSQANASARPMRSALRRATLAQPEKKLPPVSPAKPSNPRFSVTAPTPQRPPKVVAVAAPRAAYRPLNLGSADDDDDNAVEHSATAMPSAGISSPLIRIDKSEGLPVVSARDEQPGGHSLRRTRSTPELTSSFSNPAPSTPLSPSPLSSPRSPSTALPRPSLSTRHRSWLKRLSRNREASEGTSSSSPSSPTNEEPNPFAPLSPSLGHLLLSTTPLRTQCSCTHCSGRIQAGLSPGYVPHWSKGARAKWLADRKHAEMQAAQGIDASERLAAAGAGAGAVAGAGKVGKPLTLGNGPQGIVLRNARSPPPPGGAMQHYEASQRTRPQAMAIKVDGLGAAAAQREAADPAVDDEDHADAAADLRDILGGAQSPRSAGAAPAQASASSSTLATAAPPLQVDEVDRKRGEAHQPNDDPASSSSPPTVSSPPSAAAAADTSNNALISHLESRAEHNGTPVGVSPSESLPLDSDADMQHRVERDLALRMERRRSDQAIRRGGARGMLAQLEEAERREAVAREKRRVSSGGGEEQMQTQQQHAIPERPMGAWSPPPRPGSAAELAAASSSGSSGNHLSSSAAASQQQQPSPLGNALGLLRRSPSPSPFLERIKTAVRRPSLEGMHRSSSPMLRSPSPLTPGGGGGAVGQANTAAGMAVPPVATSRTPSPFLPRSPTIPEEPLSGFTMGATKPSSGLASSTPAAAASQPPAAAVSSADVPTAEELAQADTLPPQRRPSATLQRRTDSSSSASGSSASAMASAAAAIVGGGGGGLGLALSPTSLRSSGKEKEEAVASRKGERRGSSEVPRKSREGKRPSAGQVMDGFPWNSSGASSAGGSVKVSSSSSSSSPPPIPSSSSTSTPYTSTLRHASSITSGSGSVRGGKGGGEGGSGSVRRSKTLPPSSAKAALAAMERSGTSSAINTTSRTLAAPSASSTSSSPIPPPSSTSKRPSPSPPIRSAAASPSAQQAEAEAVARRLRRRSFQRRISAPLVAARGLFSHGGAGGGGAGGGKG